MNNLEKQQKTQLGTHRETKPKNKGYYYPIGILGAYAQLNRQFKLINDSIIRCKEIYPEDYHHKLKFRDELNDFSLKLKGGAKLLNQFAQKAELGDGQKAILLNFNAAISYLLFKFKESAELVDKVNETETNAKGAQ